MDAKEAMLMKIREIPALYIGKPSLTLLCTFIDGYMYRQYEIYGDDHSDYKVSFQEYVQNYYNVSRTTDSCCMLILKNSLNEKDAFYKYFELYDLYKAHFGCHKIK